MSIETITRESILAIEGKNNLEKVFEKENSIDIEKDYYTISYNDQAIKMFKRSIECEATNSTRIELTDTLYNYIKVSKEGSFLLPYVERVRENGGKYITRILEKIWCHLPDESEINYKYIRKGSVLKAAEILEEFIEKTPTLKNDIKLIYKATNKKSNIIIPEYYHNKRDGEAFINMIIVYAMKLEDDKYLKWVLAHEIGHLIVSSNIITKEILNTEFLSQYEEYTVEKICNKNGYIAYREEDIIEEIFCDCYAFLQTGYLGKRLSVFAFGDINEEKQWEKVDKVINIVFKIMKKYNLSVDGRLIEKYINISHVASEIELEEIDIDLEV